MTLSTTGSSGNVSLTNDLATTLAASTIGGSLTVTDEAGNLTQSGVLTVAGTSSFTTSASNATITLGFANVLTGAVTLDTSGASSSASLTQQSRNNSGRLDHRRQPDGDGRDRQPGADRYSEGRRAHRASRPRPSNATIVLGSANSLTGAVTLSTTGSSGSASLTNNLATTIGTSGVAGNLAVTDAVGNLTQTRRADGRRDFELQDLGCERHHRARLDRIF